jgi:hypothetical protein
MSDSMSGLPKSGHGYAIYGLEGIVSETEGFLSTVATVTPNFALLEMSHPEVASLVAAMLQARDAVERRSWSLG